MLKKIYASVLSMSLLASLCLPIGTASASEYKTKKVGVSTTAVDTVYVPLKIIQAETKDYKNKSIKNKAQKLLDKKSIAVTKEYMPLFILYSPFVQPTEVNKIDIRTVVTKKAESSKYVSYQITNKTIGINTKTKKVLVTRQYGEYINISKSTGKQKANINSILTKKINEKNAINNFKSKIYKKEDINDSELMVNLDNLNPHWYMNSKNDIIVDVTYSYVSYDDDTIKAKGYSYFGSGNVTSKISNVRVANKYK